MVDVYSRILSPMHLSSDRIFVNNHSMELQTVCVEHITCAYDIFPETETMSLGGPLTNMMVRSRTNALRSLRGVLEAHEVTSRAAFSDMMAASFGHGGLELRALSDDLSFSFSSVFRWHEGRSVPHSSLWPIVTAWIVEHLAILIAENEASLAR